MPTKVPGRLALIGAVAVAACGGSQGKPPVHDDHAPRLVGVQTIQLRAKSGAAIETRVWYPTSSGTPVTLSGNAVRIGYQAVPDAPVTMTARAPLVILMHGSGGGADGVAWIGVELAAHGAIAVAANHPASSYGAPARNFLDVWEQPDDVHAMLDQLAASSWWKHVDPERVAVIGFSLGGASAMLLAGARFDFAKVPVFCKTHEDLACTSFASMFPSLDAAYFAKADADHADPRIKAAVAIAPGFSEAMTPESVRALVPTLVIAGEKDQVLPPGTHLAPILAELRPPSTHREIKGAQHFSFLFLCTEKAVTILADSGEAYACEEPGGRKREDIHAEAVGAIETFLRDRGILTTKK